MKNIVPPKKNLYFIHRTYIHNGIFHSKYLLEKVFLSKIDPMILALYQEPVTFISKPLSSSL